MNRRDFLKILGTSAVAINLPVDQVIALAPARAAPFPIRPSVWTLSISQDGHDWTTIAGINHMNISLEKDLETIGFEDNWPKYRGIPDSKRGTAEFSLFMVPDTLRLINLEDLKPHFFRLIGNEVELEFRGTPTWSEVFVDQAGVDARIGVAIDMSHEVQLREVANAPEN